jgi:thiol-disulfide isomerase/thioredoxin
MAVKPHLQMWVLVVAAILAYGTLHYLNRHIPYNKEKPAVQQLAADAYFFDESGRKLTLRDFEGQVVLVNLWATWCPPCVVELPALNALQARLHDRPFRVVAIAMDRSSAAAVAAFLREREIEHLDIYWDQDRQIPLKWQYSGIPTSFLLDKDGRVVERFDGAYEWDKGDIFDKIERML